MAPVPLPETAYRRYSGLRTVLDGVWRVLAVMAARIINNARAQVFRMARSSSLARALRW